MAKIDCDECSESCSITTKSPEPLSYCPFCGSDINVPIDDEDVDDEDDDLVDDDWSGDDYDEDDE